MFKRNKVSLAIGISSLLLLGGCDAFDDALEPMQDCHKRVQVDTCKAALAYLTSYSEHSEITVSVEGGLVSGDIDGWQKKIIENASAIAENMKPNGYLADTCSFEKKDRKYYLENLDLKSCGPPVVSSGFYNKERQMHWDDFVSDHEVDEEDFESINMDRRGMATIAAIGSVLICAQLIIIAIPIRPASPCDKVITSYKIYIS